MRIKCSVYVIFIVKQAGFAANKMYCRIVIDVISTWKWRRNMAKHIGELVVTSTNWSIKCNSTRETASRVQSIENWWKTIYFVVCGYIRSMLHMKCSAAAMHESVQRPFKEKVSNWLLMTVNPWKLSAITGRKWCMSCWTHQKNLNKSINNLDEM